MKFWEALKALEEGKTVQSIRGDQYWKKGTRYTVEPYGSVKHSIAGLITRLMDYEEINGEWKVVGE